MGILKMLKLNLQAFAEGGAAAGGASGGGGEGAAAAAAVSSPAKSSGKAATDMSNVVYGKASQGTTASTDSAGANASNTSPVSNSAISAEDRAAAFENLIKNEYKDLYDAKVKDTISKRFKNSADTEAKLQKLSPVLEMLGKKYGVDGNDADAISKAIQEDDSYYEEEALDKGVTVAQLKEFKKLERENGEMKKAMQESQRRESAEATYSAWTQQANNLKQSFPSFDLQAELQNPKFVTLMRTPGMDVESAFYAVHHGELMPAATRLGVQMAEQKLTNSIKAGQARPAENGMNGASSAVYKTDPSQLNSRDLAEIRRRVARGEKISF